MANNTGIADKRPLSDFARTGITSLEPDLQLRVNEKSYVLHASSPPRS